MKNKRKNGHVWYLEIIQDDEREMLFKICPDLKRKLKSLPDGKGGRVSVIRIGDYSQVPIFLRSCSKKIGLWHWSRIKTEAYVRRSSRAPLISCHAFSSYK